MTTHEHIVCATSQHNDRIQKDFWPSLRVKPVRPRGFYAQIKHGRFVNTALTFMTITANLMRAQHPVNP
jgi:hypothetical protein